MGIVDSVVLILQRAIYIIRIEKAIEKAMKLTRKATTQNTFVLSLIADFSEKYGIDLMALAEKHSKEVSKCQRLE